jgi:hypothetical protein
LDGNLFLLRQSKKMSGFLTPVSKSITHTTAVKEAVQSGARGLMLTQFQDDNILNL